MSVVLFVAVADAITRMQVNADLDGAASVMRSALEGAQTFIESVLEHRLELTAQDNVYHLDKDAFSGLQPGGVFRLQVPGQFIRMNDLAHPILLTIASDWKMQEAAPLDVSEYSIESENGHVLVDAKAGADKYVRVQCATGFDPDAVLVPANPPTVPEDVRGPEPIPQWMKEAILSYVGQVFDISQTTNRSAEASAVYQRAAKHALNILTPHLRPKGFVFRKMR